jgi:ABC-type Fe3+-siderophore transport system permease subunit
MKHPLIFGALLLVIVWIIARVALAVTAVALHLLWIVAIVLAIVWVIRRVTRHK